jgi:DNA primase
MVKDYYKKNIYFHKGENGLAYLYSRGLTDEIIKLADLGYAYPGWNNLLEHINKNKMSVEQFLKLGLLKQSTNSNYRQKYYDQFRNRIIFPIKDVLGRVIGFGGRTIGDDEPKYLNSSESLIYHKSYSLYGIYQARKHIKERDYVILAEGYLDVLALWQAGFLNTIASLGTAFTKEQASIIKRYTSNIVICYDGDKAGQNAAKKAIEIMKEFGFNIKVAVIPDKQDPDDFIKKNGKDKFKKDILSKALPAIDFIVSEIANKFNLKNREEKIRFASELVKFLSNLENRLEQAGYLSTYAEQYKLDKSALEYELSRISRNNNQNKEKRVSQPTKIKEIVLTQEKKLLKLIIGSKKSIPCEIFILPNHKRLCELIQSDDWSDINDLILLAKENDLESTIANIMLFDSVEENEIGLIKQLTLVSLERKINLIRKEISETVKVGEDPTELLMEFKELEQKRAQLHTNKDFS